MSAMRRPVPFRAIAIVSDDASAVPLATTLRGAPSEQTESLALMLRDPAHDAKRVETMLASVGSLSERVVVIANGLVDTSCAWVHLPFAMRGALGELRARGAHVGVSVHSLEELAAIDDPVDYIVASPVYPTQSKPGDPGIGLDGLRAICAASPAPVFALGGIDLARIADCLAVGAAGVAAITMFASPTSLRDVTEALAAAHPSREQQ